MAEFERLAENALAELKGILFQIDETQLVRFCNTVLKARRIVCYGVGREGLMVRALCMRLMHLGLDAHMAGDMSTPPVGNGDLFLASAGPGELSTVLALMQVAKDAGAKNLLVTAQPQSSAAKLADEMLLLPAQTMADDLGGKSVLPMGSLFEIAMLVTFDLLVQSLSKRLDQTPQEMRARHTNLE